MRRPPGPWWLLLWLRPLASLPAGAVRGEEAVTAELSVPMCRALKEVDLIKTSQSNCYCYSQMEWKWKYIWSTVQVKITSSDLLSIVYITERQNCQSPETIVSVIKCVMHKFWMPNDSREITITISSYGETVCFAVKPVRNYTIHVDRNIVDFRLLLVFVAGIFLFFYAETLSQSSTFYYSSGTVLGILMTFVFFLLAVKRLIPKYSTFGALMVSCWFASVYMVYQLMENLKWLLYENRMYSLGYVFIVGVLSFAVCYKHGPLVDDRSIRLLTWTLQLLSLLLVYAGACVPQFAYAVMVLMLLSQCLPHPGDTFRYVMGKMKTWFTSEKLAVKYLTEDEYREQADAETTNALEELRQACRRPDFPSWLAISRLQTPKKFADFVLGGSHLSPEEISLHEEQYGLGGAFLEEQLFNLRTS